MTVTITYFVHGTSTDNEGGIASGWNDVDLSPRGVEEARELGRLTVDRDFDVVYCSDLIRAHRSATIAWGGSRSILIDARLRECDYGTFNGAPSNVVATMQAERIADPFPSGESCSDVEARVHEFLTELRTNYDGSNVAIVSHKTPQLALDVIVQNKTWEEALAEDWRRSGEWQPGWLYEL